MAPVPRNFVQSEARVMQLAKKMISFNVVGKTRNIAFQVVLWQCCTTKCTFWRPFNRTCSYQIKLCYFFRIRKMTPSMISLLIAIVCSVPWVNGQFPKVCVNLESLKNKTCCPKPNGYHEPCGSDGNRGECQELRVRRWDGTYSHYQEFHRKDERHNWPNALFNRTCKCKSNFAGYDCSKCEYGYYGYDCKQKRTLKRRNFAQWTKEQKDRFMSYINKTRYVSICKRIFL